VVAVFVAVAADIATTTGGDGGRAVRTSPEPAGPTWCARSPTIHTWASCCSAEISPTSDCCASGRLGGVVRDAVGVYVGNALNLEHSERVKATAHLVVRGVSYIITAWLAGELNLPAADLVDRITSILGELGDPTLYRGR